MKKLEHEILKTYYERRGENQEEYIALKVKKTVFSCRKVDFEVYVLDCSEELWNKVMDRIGWNLMPYMTLKSINYEMRGSNALRHSCEKKLGSGIYVDPALMMYMIASTGVIGKNKNDEPYPTELYYPLSKKFMF